MSLVKKYITIDWCTKGEFHAGSKGIPDRASADLGGIIIITIIKKALVMTKGIVYLP